MKCQTSETSNMSLPTCDSFCLITSHISTSSHFLPYRVNTLQMKSPESSAYFMITRKRTKIQHCGPEDK